LFEKKLECCDVCGGPQNGIQEQEKEKIKTGQVVKQSRGERRRFSGLVSKENRSSSFFFEKKGTSFRFSMKKRKIRGLHAQRHYSYWPFA
jgi:hypothetical protein